MDLRWRLDLLLQLLTKELKNATLILFQHVRRKVNNLEDMLENEGVLSQSHLYDIDIHFTTSLDIWSDYQNIVAKDMTTRDAGAPR